MIRLRQLNLRIDHGEGELHRAVERRLGLDDLSKDAVTVFQRAIDARTGKPLRFSYTVDVDVSAEEETRLLRRDRKGFLQSTPQNDYRFLKDHAVSPGEERPLIVGTGPAGLFAGLLLAQMGLKPILFERGKMAGPRARDVTKFWRTGEFDPESNVQFGEGGAGTFSDGKLYTQIKDREHRCRKVLEELAAHGAPEDILMNARPHIGTDRLIKVLRNLRETIHSLGGVIHYESKVVDLDISDGKI